MIPIKDLRIGNWVDVAGQFTYITCIGEKQVEVMATANITHPDQIHPIPLTPELLEKAGFEKRGETAIYDKVPWVGLTYQLETKRLMIHHTGNVLAEWLHTDIRYLHQLQNFFYCLIGYDLPIQL